MSWGDVIQNWSIQDQYRGISIPSRFSGIEDFVTWYLSNRKPILIPMHAPVIITDDATAITLFRQKNFQVELYLIHPGYSIQLHSHPGVNLATMLIGGGGTNPKGEVKYTPAGQKHGGGGTNHTGFALLAFEEWLDGIEPTSAALQWEGPTAGPIHDALINKEVTETTK